MKLAGWKGSCGFAVILLLCQGGQGRAAASAPAASPFALTLGSEIMSGDITYAVGNGFTATSELEWPLDVWLTRLSAAWNVNPKWRLSTTLKGNFTDPDERVIDRDWLTAPGRLDIYSESEVSSLDALFFDIEVEYTFWQQGLWTMRAGLGYQQQEFQYQSALLFQYSPSGLPGYSKQGRGGTTASYELSCSMPYLRLGAAYQLTPELRLTGSFALAPLFSADDATRLFWDKQADSEMDGLAAWFDIAGLYQLTPAWSVQAGLHHAWLDAQGEQQQTVKGRNAGEFAMEADSRQTSFSLSLSYSF